MAEERTMNYSPDMLNGENWGTRTSTIADGGKEKDKKKQQMGRACTKGETELLETPHLKRPRVILG